MQNELISSVNGDPFRSTIESLPYPYLEQPPLSSLHLPSNSGDLFYSYNSSPFSPSSLSLSPSPVSTNGGDDPAATENRLYLARLALQYQEIADRYERCLSHLQEASEEAETLRHENARLRMANGDLTSCLAMASNNQVSLLANDFNRMGLGAEAVPETSPTSVLPLQPLNENQLLRHAAERRAVLPKSISIRSSGYLKMNQPAPQGPQKVLVGLGGNKSGEEKRIQAPVLKEVGEDISSALEVEVYNQGMFKTELCNKWEESGECPYGEHCQFAHGISELRPVLRHPRYKTELCRMVLAGEACPYGHRCHFRHTLSPSERLLLQP
ncbi:zinc finger CCCH domain-containing protein 9-like protein [Carex littledalei]|uniref:Zinc finger CCCH domain-containing protein 9-like protein n=1 Tax=Carex littledalei TaxID=544730 RepID=A0A833RE62_9POAL|nr:zinc finger CCCH domain-containing protein 9-like protein [Carex littledalei]